MSVLKRHLAHIGRRGGIKSRRVLDPETARQMVRAREARRAARRAHQPSARRARGTASDTSATIQRIQDALWLRLTPAEKLAQVAGLSRLVAALSFEGFRMRHPDEDIEKIRFRRAALSLGKELAARVYGTPRDVA